MNEVLTLKDPLHHLLKIKLYLLFKPREYKRTNYYLSKINYKMSLVCHINITFKVYDYTKISLIYCC